MDSVFFRKQPPNREGLYWGLQQKNQNTWEIVRTKLQDMKKQAHDVKYYDTVLQAVLVPFQYILEDLFLFLPVQISNSKWYYKAIFRNLKFCGNKAKISEIWPMLHTLNNSRKGARTLHFLQTSVKLPPSNWGALSTPASAAGDDLFRLDWMISVRELQLNISLCC